MKALLMPYAGPSILEHLESRVLFAAGPDLTGSLIAATILPKAISGTAIHAKVTVRVTNAGNLALPANQRITIQLIAHDSAANGTNNSDIVLSNSGSLSVASWKTEHSQNFTVPMNSPLGVPAGSYQIEAKIIPVQLLVETDTANNLITLDGSGNALTFISAVPFYDLGGALVGGMLNGQSMPANIVDDARISGSVAVNVKNLGNISLPANKRITIQIIAEDTTANSTNNSDIILSTSSTLSVASWKPGHVQNFTVRVNAPLGIAADSYQIEAKIVPVQSMNESDGGLVFFASEYKTDAIYAVYADGTMSTFAAHMNDAGQLAFDSSGNLYAPRYDTGTISKIAPDGSVSTFAAGLHNPSGLAFDKSGNLYVSDANGGTTISRITPDGTVTTFAAGLSQPGALAFDAAGNLYAPNYLTGTVSKIDPKGNISTFASGLPGATGLIFDGKGNLYVSLNVHDNEGTIDRIAPNGSVSTYATGVYNPYYFYGFDSRGDLAVGVNLLGTTGDSAIAEVTPIGAVSIFTESYTTAAATPVPIINNNLLTTDASGRALTVVAAAPFFSFGVALGTSTLPASIKASSAIKGTLMVTVENVGNLSFPSNEHVSIQILARSADSDSPLGTTAVFSIASWKPGRAVTFAVHVKASAGLAAGSYQILALISSDLGNSTAMTDVDRDSIVLVVI